jgi:hypothetical protein
MRERSDVSGSTDVGVCALLPPLDDDGVWTALVSDVSEDSEEETARFSAVGVTAVVSRTLNA